jgi:SlyX protein
MTNMSDTTQPDAARLDALETRIAHQDQTIADLNEVITAQWRKIDLLERSLARLREEFQTLDTRRDGPEPPPPHY